MTRKSIFTIFIKYYNTITLFIGGKVMARTIRIDDEVYGWLQSQAHPLEDTPNSVLRRAAGLDSGVTPNLKSQKEPRLRTTKMQPNEKTPQRAFRKPILKILNAHGGEMHRGKVLQELKNLMENQLTDYDNSCISSGTIRWEKSAEWEVRVMREEGLLKPVSETPRGVWALTDMGREEASRTM